MTRLRRRMSEDMQVRGLSSSTQRVYLERVTPPTFLYFSWLPKKRTATSLLN